ncbi:unnamed protein product [Brassica rapa subsp. trilocularis]
MAFPQNGFMFQQLHEDSSYEQLPSCPSIHLFNGGGNYMMNRSMSLMNVQVNHLSVDEENLSEDGSHMMLGEKKKKRLQLEQHWGCMQPRQIAVCLTLLNSDNDSLLAHNKKLLAGLLRHVIYNPGSATLYACHSRYWHVE